MGRPAKMTHTSVLDVTYALIWEKGCDDVTIRNLEAALDLRAPSIYRRFGSRDELLAAAIDRYSERVVQWRISRFLDDASDPLQGIREFFLSVVSPERRGRSPRGCLLTATSQQAAVAVAPIGEAVGRGLALIEAALHRTLERAVAQGSSFDVPIAELTSALVQVFQGVLVVVRSGSDDLDTSVNLILDALLSPIPSQGEATP